MQGPEHKVHQFSEPALKKQNKPSLEMAEVANMSRPRSKPQGNWNNLGVEQACRVLWAYTKIACLSSELRLQPVRTPFWAKLQQVPKGSYSQ